MNPFNILMEIFPEVLCPLISDYTKCFNCEEYIDSAHECITCKIMRCSYCHSIHYKNISCSECNDNGLQNRDNVKCTRCNSNAYYGHLYSKEIKYCGLCFSSRTIMYYYGRYCSSSDCISIAMYIQKQSDEHTIINYDHRYEYSGNSIMVCKKHALKQDSTLKSFQRIMIQKNEKIYPLLYQKI